MNADLLVSDLNKVREKVKIIEDDFQVKLNEVETRNAKFIQIDTQIDKFRKENESKIFTLNIGGKVYKTKIKNLLSIKDTFFYYIISQRLDHHENPFEQIFFDRSYKNFDFFIDYLRSKKFTIANLQPTNLNSIFEDAKFYGFGEITNEIELRLKEVEIINMNGTSNKYSNAGTHDFKDLKDKSMMKGICVESPYTIQLEFNYEHVFNKIQVGGYNGNTSTWGPTNGANAKIWVSKDNVTWKEVGVLPSDHGNKISDITLKEFCTAKFIKFTHNSYLGIGYLNICKS
jgi:hypothetical protein